MKKQTCSSSAAAVGLHKNSQTISKTKPKIRIIHIFAPEIIKTDVANFRELVQRLTGKPTADHLKVRNMKKPRLCRRRQDHHHQQEPATVSRKMEQLRNGLNVVGNFGTTHQRVKEEDDHDDDNGDRMMVWGSSHNHHYDDDHQNSSGGFLNDFADLDGFIQELGDQFPLFPTDHASAHHHHHHNNHIQYATSEETHQLA